MANEIQIQTVTGKTLVAQIVAPAGTVWSSSALAAVSSLTDAQWTAGLIAVTEEQTSDGTGTGLYLADWPGALTQNARYTVLFFESAAPAPGSLVYGVQDDPTGVLDADIYFAESEFTLAASNTIDRHTIRWNKNGTWLTSGVTVPTLQLIDLSDGSELMAAASMNDAAADDSFVLDVSASGDRLTTGQPAEAVFQATIDGSARTHRDFVSRDST